MVSYFEAWLSPVHDALDAISLRSWLNSPWAGNMADQLYKGANILRKFNEVGLVAVFGLASLSGRGLDQDVRDAGHYFDAGHHFDWCAYGSLACGIGLPGLLLPDARCLHFLRNVVSDAFGSCASLLQAIRLEPERGLPSSLLAGARGLALLSVVRLGAGWSCTAGTGKPCAFPVAHAGLWSWHA
jgi:hypothetical protein